MTDIARARESAVTAETKVEHFFNEVLDKLNHQNARLAQLHDEIKSSQPISSGSVCLEMYPCGPGCTGCPHPRWVKYRWSDDTAKKAGMLMGTNLDASKKDPVLALARSEPHYQKTVALVREAKTILKERSGLLTSLRSLRYAAKLP